MNVIHNPEADAHLIEGCRQNCYKSQAAVYNKYYKKMLTICLNYLDDHMAAEDVLQTSFIKVFAHINSYTGNGSFEFWVKRIVINAAVDELRRIKQLRRLHLHAYNNPGHNDACPFGVDENTNRAYLQQCLFSIPNNLRVPFQLNVLEGYSHREIASMTGITETLSRVNVVRARQRLKKLYHQTMVVQYAASYRAALS